MVYRAMGRLGDAEKALRTSLELSPQRISTHHLLGFILADQGRDAEALALTQREPAEWARLTGLAYVHWLGGRKQESDEALRELESKHAADSAYQIAAIHAVRGDADAAFRWLNRAVAERDAGAAQAGSEPIFRRLHGDPRWRDLMRKLRLEP